MAHKPGEEPPVLGSENSDIAAVSAMQPAGQMFEIGTLPYFNALLYENSPAQLAANELFQTLALRTDARDDLDLTLSLAAEISNRPALGRQDVLPTDRRFQ